MIKIFKISGGLIKECEKRNNLNLPRVCLKRNNKRTCIAYDL